MTRPLPAAIRTPQTPPPGRSRRRLAFFLMAPALFLIGILAIVPLVGTAWEAFHLHDLRMPWRGSPWVGLSNFAEALGSDRFRDALGHTLFFAFASVAVEVVLGTALALVLHRAFLGRGLARALVLVPWAIPTVVAGLLFRILFDGEFGPVNSLLVGSGILDRPLAWLAHPRVVWIPLILADAWKTSPFVALLVLAGLQNIDPALHEAARIDGASAFRRFTLVTLPLLRPALLVAILFRLLDALRVFDLVYVLTGGGPGNSTEPLSQLTFDALLHNLRFGYGAALSVCLFLLNFVLAVLLIRLFRVDLLEEAR